MTKDTLFSRTSGTNSLADLCISGLDAVLKPGSISGARYSGKVRDRLDLGDKVLLFTSDRVSAFDHILGLVPFKGEVLNRLSLFWFERTRDIIQNHVISAAGSRGMLCRKARVLPVEVVVRGYLTGSAWRDYQSGKPISGITLPAGLHKDQRFATPLITPSTKEELGSHDMPISTAEIVSRGLVKADLWAQVERAALALFARGTELAAKSGLLLVDTKYEFGVLETGPDAGTLILVDEIHTPDSSRFWYAETYPELFTQGVEQRKLDKEYLRAWLMEQGWSGTGSPPAIPDSVYLELAWRYIQAFQEISGTNFEPESDNTEADVKKLLSVL